MPVYPTSPFSTRMTWPDPIEPIWQMLSGGGTRLTGWKRPDIGLCDRLFIGDRMPGGTPKDENGSTLAREQLTQRSIHTWCYEPGLETDRDTCKHP
jgi:hypothetical protein